ncbi:MAG: dephospho-CoA kinase [Rubrivivax sp.]
MDRLGLTSDVAAALPIRTIGLTGGIGSGKSTAAQVLVDCGAHLVDTDAISRALTAAGGAAMAPLAAAFGQQVVALDGALDRARMRELAFGDPQVKAQLERVLHPLIGAETGRQAEAAQGRPVVYDVPLLAESTHWRARVERVLVIDCDEATQIDRVAQRPGWSREMAQRVIAQQAPRAVRLAIADAVILNVGLTLAQFQEAVRSVWRSWQERA